MIVTMRGNRRPPDDQLPTIGLSRDAGMVAVVVHCLGGLCGRNKRFLFDELRLPDSTILIDIGKFKRFRCDGCGSRKVEIVPDWRDVKHHGGGRPKT